MFCEVGDLFGLFSSSLGLNLLNLVSLALFMQTVPVMLFLRTHQVRYHCCFWFCNAKMAHNITKTYLGLILRYSRLYLFYIDRQAYLSCQKYYINDQQNELIETIIKLYLIGLVEPFPWLNNSQVIKFSTYNLEITNINEGRQRLRFKYKRRLITNELKVAT